MQKNSHLSVSPTIYSIQKIYRSLENNAFTRHILDDLLTQQHCPGIDLPSTRCPIPLSAASIRPGIPYIELRFPFSL